MGFAPPAGTEEAADGSVNLDLMRRSMQDIPYTVINVLQCFKHLIQRSKQKIVVIT